MPQSPQVPQPKVISTSEVKAKPETGQSLSNQQQWSLPLMVAAIILAVGAGWVGNWWFNSGRNQNSSVLGAMAGQGSGASVKLMTLKTGIIEDSSEVVGTMEAQGSVVIKPEIEGRISKILVTEGDRIRKGQTIVSLDKGDWEAALLEARAKLASAQARLAELEVGSRREDIEEARARVQEAETRLANAKAGALPEEIAQAQFQLEGARAEAELAQQRVIRYGQLQEEGAISADQFHQVKTEARSANALVEQAQRRLAQLTKSRQSDIQEIAATVERERQNLRRLENGPRSEVIAQAKANVAEAAAQVRLAEVNRQKTQILAPIAGIVGDIPVEVGDYLQDGDTLTTITENDILELNLSIPLEKAFQLRLGLPVEILDPQGKASATGKISFISPNVNPDSQLVLAKASFANVRGGLLNRQFIQARIIWEKRPGILIPAAAVSRLGRQTFVFVAQANDSQASDGPQLLARQRQVTLGNLQGNDYQVLEGLQAGEKIVTAGILNLTDGVAIQHLK
jgi:RND family efflux transporter MFP subunit